MFTKNNFPFDPAQMAEFLKSNDFSNYFNGMKLPSFDTDALVSAQQKNLDALANANKAAAEGYQQLFAKQVAVFEETMAAAKEQIEAADVTTAAADGGKAQTELVQAAVEKAIGNMRELAEVSQKASAGAYEIMAKRVQESVQEVQDFAKKAGK